MYLNGYIFKINNKILLKISLNFVLVLTFTSTSKLSLLANFFRSLRLDHYVMNVSNISYHLKLVKLNPIKVLDNSTCRLVKPYDVYSSSRSSF